MKSALAGVLLFLAALAVLGAPLDAPVPKTVYLEDMTWVEVKAALEKGKNGVIVPTAGHEQNGPHMVLGKHHYVVRHTAGRIAEELTTALVAPVVTYAPEGDIAPPSGHMILPGTISLPPRVFGEILEFTALSLRAHGFKNIYFLGDSFDNQAVQAEVAERLNRDWSGSGIRVLHVSDYYAANRQIEWLLEQGETESTIGSHAGIRDTSELMAVHPEGVRGDMLNPKWGLHLGFTGANGDPTRASVARGESLLRLKIDAAMRQIRAASPSGK